MSNIAKMLAESAARGKSSVPGSSASSSPTVAKMLAESASRSSVRETPIRQETISSTPTTLAAGPRREKLKAQEVLRPSTPNEIALQDDPKRQALIKKIIAESPGSIKESARNNAPTGLHNLATKTLPAIRDWGQRILDNAPAVQKKYGVPISMQEAIGNITTGSADTVSDFVSRAGELEHSKNSGEAARNVINLGISGLNLGSIAFLAATEAAGLYPIVGKPAKAVIKGSAEAVHTGGGYILGNAYSGYYNAFTGKILDPNDPNLATVKEVGGLATILIGAKAFLRGTTKLQAKISPAYAASKALGLPDYGYTQEMVNKNFQNAAKEAIASEKNVQIKLDALKVSRQILEDKISSNKSGNKKWDDSFISVNEVVDEAMTNSNGVLQGLSTASDVTTALTRSDIPFAERQAAKNRLLGDEVGRLAFEQEIKIESTKNDGERAKTAEANGAIFERDYLNTTDQPAGYRDGKIIFNDQAIQATVDKIFSRGEGQAKVTIKTGEGANTSFKELVKKPGEAPADFRAKYEDVLFDHELAHHALELRSPEIMAKRQRMEVAQLAGDMVTAEKLRKELESAAHTQIKITRTAITKALAPHEISAIDKALAEHAQIETIKQLREKLRFPEASTERAYKDWRQVTKSGELANADWGVFVERVSKDTAKKIDDGLRRGQTHDKLLDSFRDRLAKEKAVNEQAKAQSAERATNRQKRRTLTENNADAQIRRIARAEVRNEMSQKIDLIARKNELAILKERIKSRDITAAEKGRLENKYKQKLQDLKRNSKMKLLRQRIEDRYRTEKQAKKTKKLQEKVASGKATRQEIVDFMKANRVPYEVRGRFVTGLKNAKTPADSMRIVNEIKAEFNEFQRKKSVKRIEKRLKSYKKQGVKKNVDAQAQKDIALVQSYMAMSRSEVIDLIENKVTEARKTLKEDAPLPMEVAREIELLEMGGLEEQSARQTLRTEAQLKSLMKDGRTIHEEKVASRLERINRIATTTASKLTGSEEMQIHPKKKVHNFLRRIEDRALDNLDTTFTIDQLASRLSQSAEDFVGRATTAVARAVDESNKIKAEAVKQLDAIYGHSFQLEQWQINNTQIPLKGVRMSNGTIQDIYLTRSEMIDAYMKAKNKGTRENLRTGNLFTDEVIKKIEDALSPQDKAMAEWLMKKGYADQHAPLARSVEKNSDIALGYAHNYSGPVSHVLEKTTAETIHQTTALDVQNANAQYHVSNNPGLIKSRQKTSRPIRLSKDVMADFFRYTEDAQHLIHAGGFSQDMAVLLKDPLFNQSVANTLGKEFLKTFKDNAEDVLRPRISGGKGAGIIGDIVNNTAGYLVNTWSVASGQLSAVFGAESYAATLGITARDFWGGARNMKSVKDALYKNTPELSARKNDVLPEGSFGKKLAIRGKGGLAFAKLQKTLSDIGLVQAADVFTSERSAAGVFIPLIKRYMSEGMSLKDAQKQAGIKAGKMINATQPSNLNIAKGSAFKNEGLKPLLALKQAPSKMFNFNVDIIRQARAGKISVGTATKAIVLNAVIQHVVYSLIKQTYSAGKDAVVGTVAGAVGDDKLAKEKLESAKKKMSLKEQGTSIGVNVFSSAVGAPFVGDIMTVSLQNLVLKKNYSLRPFLLGNIINDGVAAMAAFNSGKIDKTVLLTLRTTAASIGMPDPTGLLSILIGLPSKTKPKTREQRKAINDKARETRRQELQDKLKVAYKSGV